MFPWDHLAIGYLGVSALFRLRGVAVTDGAAFAVALGSQFPDLVDKPLAWVFEVLPSGTTLAHSVFVAVPLSALVYVVAMRLDRPRVGAAFAVGYLLHLPADILYGPLALGRPLEFGGLLWPLVPKTGTAVAGDIFVRVAYYVTRLYANTGSPDAMAYLLLELVLLVAVLALWVDDGMPGYRPVRAVLTRDRA